MAKKVVDTYIYNVENLVTLGKNGFNEDFKEALSNHEVLEKIGITGLTKILERLSLDQNYDKKPVLTEFLLEKGAVVKIRSIYPASNSYRQLISEKSDALNVETSNLKILTNHLEKNVKNIDSVIFNHLVKFECYIETVKILIKKGVYLDQNTFYDFIWGRKTTGDPIEIYQYDPLVKNDLIKLMLMHGVSTEAVTLSKIMDKTIKKYIKLARAVSIILKGSNTNESVDIIKSEMSENSDLIIGRFNAIFDKLYIENNKKCKENNEKLLIKLRENLATRKLCEISIAGKSIAEILFESSKILKEKYLSFENFSNTNKILNLTKSVACDSDSVIKEGKKAENKHNLINKLSKKQIEPKESDLIAESSAIDNSAEI